VQIASGLQAGEQVITEGADRLKEGAKVTLPGAGGGRRPHNGAAGAAPGTPAAAAEGASAPAHERRHRKEQGAAQ
jgi:multidrug efflux system membrane fusion protein